MSPAARLIDWVERGTVPDAAIRYGIRRLLRERLEEIEAADCERSADVLERFVARMAAAPVAPLPELANDQHYELPPALFGAALGPHRKYSCCHWPDGVTTLAGAEQRALALTCERAQLADGQRILELGCGWGSLTLYMAERYPHASITGVTNSLPQRDFVTAAAAARGLRNVRVLLADMNEFDAGQPFARIVSVEMFEHLRNWEEMFQRVARWLERDGRFFMHVFCHRSTPYEFVDSGPTDWMSRYFFSGGMMPSDDLPLRFQKHLTLERRWRWSGAHYARTAEAWLQNFDARRAEVDRVLAAAYGEAHAEQWRQRWRMFFMACAELFGFADGQEWYVSHYRFARADAS
ncbi:MAG TPA: cyclopropane-fatty-acyl-phospholipid synthase family protein [Gammaproteobacteria bacterium]|jgi:cyclopropane-fatty-acyl-phospholipid synthase|nr:cyclopropane-fatty-acyl-phospholipid synthase family protein [Gammaproteobacteria bacterium]